MACVVAAAAPPAIRAQMMAGALPPRGLDESSRSALLAWQWLQEANEASRNRRDPLGDLQTAMTALIEATAPAVVSIQTDRRPGSILPDETDSALWVTQGSGVVFRPDGMILTCQHVVEDALAVTVTLESGRQYRARIVGGDARSDLAVIRIAAGDLPYLSLTPGGKLRRGQWVVALGHPLGLSIRGQAAASSGLISAIGRPLPAAFGAPADRYYGDMIQIAADIGPGHSGGPLVDIDGHVIGILTAIGTASAGSDNIAFAQPIDARTRRIIEDLSRGLAIEYGYIGVDVSNESASPFVGEGSIEPGAVVDAVTPGSPADRAGMRRGDLIVAVGGLAVGSADDFVRRIGSLAPGVGIEIEFLRGRERRRGPVFVAVRPPPSTVASTSIEFHGASAQLLDEAVRRQANFPAHALLVTRVERGSAADRAGLSPGDVITRLDGRPLTADAPRVLAAFGGDCLVGLANGESVLLEGR
jgi:serine protease Do